VAWLVAGVGVDRRVGGHVSGRQTGGETLALVQAGELRQTRVWSRGHVVVSLLLKG
jgi:hypothetical protein